MVGDICRNSSSVRSSVLSVEIVALYAGFNVFDVSCQPRLTQGENGEGAACGGNSKGISEYIEFWHKTSFVEIGNCDGINVCWNVQ